MKEYKVVKGDCSWNIVEKRIAGEKSKNPGEVTWVDIMSEYVNPKEVFLDDIDGLRIENPEGYEGPMVSYTRTDTIPSEIDQAWEFFNWIKKICDHIGNSPDFEDDMSHEKKVALAMGIAVKVLKDLEDEEITKKEAGL